MLFGFAFDPVDRITGITVRNRHERTYFVGSGRRLPQDLRHEIDDLADIKFVGHEKIPLELVHSAPTAPLFGHFIYMGTRMTNCDKKMTILAARCAGSLASIPFS